MPFFFSKFTSSSKRNNPYANPHHPSRVPVPQNGASGSQPSEPIRPASPRGSIDYLAEARMAVNRDPVTGKVLSQPNIPPSSMQPQGHSSAAGSGTAERSAYASRASQSPQTMGTRYDLFTMEERKRMEREEKIRIARGGQEYYAPERRIGEFYAGGVRDW